MESPEAGPSRCTTASATLHDEPGVVKSRDDDERSLQVQIADEIGGEPVNVAPVVVKAEDDVQVGAKDEPPIAESSRRWFLLFIFSLASFLDVSCRSGVVLFTTPIMNDLDIVYQSSTWIPVSFSVPFACFLLFWGRVCDLFSPKWVFVSGFYALGLTCVVVSVCPEMYSFFIFRGLCGLFCSATIPAGFRLIMSTFAGKERGTAITIFSLSGAVANAAGFMFASFFSFITAQGQMSAWRWYFRLVALLAVVFSSLALRFIPREKVQTTLSHAERWRRFDLPGCFIFFSSTLLFIVSLTLGATYGWKTAKFLVPFLLSWPIGVAFFMWERTLAPGYALIPPATWKIRNVALLLLVSLAAFGYWPGTQLPLIEIWLSVYHEKPIIAAVRLIPQGIASVLPMFILPHVPSRWKSSRWFIVVPYFTSAFMLLYLIESHGQITGSGYWRYLFPSFIIASFFGACSFTGISVSVMLSVPDEMSGVAGALMQVMFQLGGASTFAIQAGILTIFPGSIRNFHNVQASWWFFAGWYVVAAIAVAVLYRDPKTVKSDAENAVEDEAVADVEAEKAEDEAGDTVKPLDTSSVQLGRAISRMRSIT